MSDADQVPTGHGRHERLVQSVDDECVRGPFWAHLDEEALQQLDRLERPGGDEPVVVMTEQRADLPAELGGQGQCTHAETTTRTRCHASTVSTGHAPVLYSVVRYN
jgi:hypothetical protein